MDDRRNNNGNSHPPNGNYYGKLSLSSSLAGVMSARTMTTMTTSSSSSSSSTSNRGEPREQQRQQQHDDDDEEGVAAVVPSEQRGSTVGGAIFNFTNCIVGAGAIGLGGAFAESGGAVSVLSIVFFAFLTKQSLDLVIRLTLQQQSQSQSLSPGSGPMCTYEDLGRVAFGPVGRMVVLSSKFLYAFGCLIAYTVVVKDNFGPAVRSLIYGNGEDGNGNGEGGGGGGADRHNHHHDGDQLYRLLSDPFWLTWFVSFTVMLPLCLLRDMTPLSSLSIVGNVAMVWIVAIVAYLWCYNPRNQIRLHGGTLYQNWLEIRWDGYLRCLGTFVFTFVSQHTVHLAFASLKPEYRTQRDWQTVSAASLGLAGTISLSVGLFVYMTFWEATKSDIFELYPSIPVVDLAKLLLCVTMLLTFPFPFFTCRDMVIVLVTGGGSGSGNADGGSHPPNTAREECQRQPSRRRITDGQQQQRQQQQQQSSATIEEGLASDLEEPLLPPPTTVEGEEVSHEPQVTATTTPISSRRSGMTLQDVSNIVNHAILLPGQDRQLKLLYHVILTAKLWVVVTWLAIVAPSLGDVLDLVGCASGTIIAFVFPGLLAIRLEGPSFAALSILVVGGTVGVIGTFFSVKKLIGDL